MFHSLGVMFQTFLRKWKRKNIFFFVSTKKVWKGPLFHRRMSKKNTGQKIHQPCVFSPKSFFLAQVPLTLPYEKKWLLGEQVRVGISFRRLYHSIALHAKPLTPGIQSPTTITLDARSFCQNRENSRVFAFFATVGESWTGEKLSMIGSEPNPHHSIDN